MEKFSGTVDQAWMGGNTSLMEDAEVGFAGDRIVTVIFSENTGKVILEGGITYRFHQGSNLWRSLKTG